MKGTCARWKCENERYKDNATCVEHPPLQDHGLSPNNTECPKCGKEGMGTIHDTLWYCLDDYGYQGCGELANPYKIAGVEEKPRWNPEEVKKEEGV